jgi:hypothetical protein
VAETILALENIPNVSSLKSVALNYPYLFTDKLLYPSRSSRAYPFPFLSIVMDVLYSSKIYASVNAVA